MTRITAKVAKKAIPILLIVANFAELMAEITMQPISSSASIGLKIDGISVAWITSSFPSIHARGAAKLFMIHLGS